MELAVTGCPCGYRLSMRYSLRNREDDKKLYMTFPKKNATLTMISIMTS